MRASKFHASDPPIAEKRRVSARPQMQKPKSPDVIEINQRKPWKAGRESWASFHAKWKPGSKGTCGNE